MAHRADFKGVQSFSSVIEALEKRFLKQNAPEEEEESSIVDESQAEDAAKKKKKKSKKLKPTKEEEEWIREGEGFIDDSEVVMDDELEEAYPQDSGALDESMESQAKDGDVGGRTTAGGRNRFVAVRMDRSAFEDAKSRGTFSGESQSREKYLAQYLDEWVPPLNVQHCLFALEQAVRKGFETPKDWNARRRKGLGRIEAELLRVDRAARRVLDGGKRNHGYIAKLVAAFPSPFTRGKVVAHLERALLRRSLRRRERQLQKLTKEAGEAIQKRLMSSKGIAEPPPPNLSTFTMASVDLSPLEKEVCKPDDEDALDCLNSIAMEAERQTPSTETLKRLNQHLKDWAHKALSNLPSTQPPPEPFVAAREQVERLLRTDPYFSWDGPTRAAVWKLGEACRECARARDKLDAWVVERSMDLILGGGEGVIKNFRPRPKSLADYLLEAERELITKVFRTTDLTASGRKRSEMDDIGKRANIIRAMCENPADYYFVDEEGEFTPLPAPIPEVSATAEANQANQTGADGSQVVDDKTGEGGAGDDSTAPVSTSSGAGGATTTTTTTPTAAAAGMEPGKAYFSPSKGRRFQRVEWNLEDFERGKFVPRSEQPDADKADAKNASIESASVTKGSSAEKKVSTAGGPGSGASKKTKQPKSAASGASEGDAAPPKKRAKKAAGAADKSLTDTANKSESSTTTTPTVATASISATSVTGASGKATSSAPSGDVKPNNVESSTAPVRTPAATSAPTASTSTEGAKNGHQVSSSIANESSAAQ